ncbi:MAG TPA: DNA-directed RNA polymerase subunit omega, partial [Psychromonas hadalis]|nr:DNA-directed RNA polymerase subunit omega [Psychromonas hadalis]
LREIEERLITNELMDQQETHDKREKQVLELAAVTAIAEGRG